MGFGKQLYVEIPNDFKLVALSGGVVPGTPSFKIELNASGEGIYYFSERGDTNFVEQNRFQLRSMDLHFVYDNILEYRFFDLAPQYIDPEVLDGSFAQLTVTANGRTHTVKTRNQAVNGFDNIMVTLNIITPGENDMHYNELMR